MAKILFLLTVVPLIELVVLIRVGARIGVSSTILIILITGCIGAVLLRLQGIAVLRSIQQSVGQGRVPAREMVEGLLVLVGGVTLLTPGFVTDAFGVLLLVPVTRKVIAAIVLGYITRQVHSGRWNVMVQRQSFRGQSAPAGDDVIDGEFRRMK